MMAAVRSWLLAVIAVSLLCAVAEALMPPGAVRRVGRLVCSLALVGAVLSPLTGLDVEGGQQWVEDYFASLRQREGELEETVNSQMKTLIEQEYAAYIVDKAAELGWTCQVRVECELSEEGLYLPVRAEVSGPLTEQGRARIARLLEEDLGVRQITMDKEEMP